MNYQKIIDDLQAAVLPISAPGDVRRCCECDVWTDTAVSFVSDGERKIACTRHLPVDGRTRDQQWTLVQHILHG